MVAKRDAPVVFEPRDRAAWRKWLEAHHDRSEGVWVVIYKKGASRSNLSYNDVVEEALAFGWIDSRPNKIDDQKYKLMMTPRKPGSIWATSNKLRVEELTRKGLMTPAGMVKVEAAKRNGSWDALDEIEKLTIPDDLREQMDKDLVARDAFFHTSPSHQKQYLYWIAQAKRPETRQKRIKRTVQMVKENKDLDWK